MMIKKPTRLRSILVAVLLVLMPVQPLLASVAILNVQLGPGGKPTARSLIKDTVVGERFEASQKEIVEVLLSDGTSLTLGPGAAMVIESFTYDPQSQSGHLSVRLERGQFRVVGGLLNNTGNIAVQTPSGKLDLDSAAVFVEVQSSGATRASLLHGKSLKMTTNGKSETVERPAFEVVAVAPNQPLKTPSRQDPKTVEADALALNSQSLIDEQGGGGVGDPGGQGSLVLASLSATGSERPFTSSQPTTTSPPTETPPTETPPTETPPTETPPTETPPTETPPTETPPTQTPPPPRPGVIPGALNPFGGFGAGSLLGAANLDPEQASDSQDGARSLAQNRVTVTKEQLSSIDPDEGEDKRFAGATTNRIFNSSEPFTQTVQESDDPNSNGKIITPSRAIDSNTATTNQIDPNRLQYVFIGGEGKNLVALDAVGDESNIDHIGAGANFSISAPIAFPFIIDDPGTVEKENIFNLKGPMATTVTHGTKITTFVQKNIEVSAFNQSPINSIFGDAQYSLLQAGFSVEMLGASPLVTRSADNFILVQIRPAVVTLTRLQDLQKSPRPEEIGQATDFLTKLGFLADDKFPLFPEVNRLALAQEIYDATSRENLEARLAELEKNSTIDKDEGHSFEVLRLANRAVKMELDPNRKARFLFATGDVDGRLNPNFKSEFSVDRYFISPGLENFEEGVTTEAAGKVVFTGRTVASSIRAFLRNETKLGIPLTDTGLYVINPKSSDPESDATLLHADFGLDGNRENQKSTISVTIGKVDYKSVVCPSTECDTPETSYEAVVSGRTIGSSHNNNDRNAETGRANASVLFSSRLDSTAAGGGNPLLPVEGKAGYFILENVDPKDPTFKKDDPNSGGFEKPLDANGGKSDTQYAYLRLATATGSSQPTLRNESTLNGWMGGLAEFQNGSEIGLTQIDSGKKPDNVKIQTSPTNNTVEANFTLQGQVEEEFTTFNLGGISVNGASAFVDDNRFAARSINNGSEVAMVSADLFRDANGKLPATLNLPDGISITLPDGTPTNSIPPYEHLKWGFFFGDTKTATGEREHVHLGTWIAGKILDVEQVKALKGTASYSGHSIGNVFNNGSLYTAVGNFNNQWNFDKRTGNVQMHFDTKDYTGQTTIKDNSNTFTGTLSAPSAPARSGGLNGSFVAPTINSTPAAVMGGFSIAEGNTYRAAGTFGAQKTQ